MRSAVEQLETRVMLSNSPTITLPGAQTVGENQSLALSGSSAISVIDARATGASDMVTLTVSHGTLSLGSTPGSTSVTGNGTSNVSLSDTVANLNTALGGLTYTPSTNFAGQDSIQVSIDDTGDSQTASASVNVTVNGPTVTTTGGTTLSYTQGGAASVIDSGITVNDPGATITGATVAITGNFSGGQDVLSFANTSTITGSYFNGILILSGSDTPAHYQAALRSVMYQDTSLDPSTATRTITFSYTDTHGTSNQATDSVTVTAVNVAPTVSLPAAQTIGVNETLDFGSSTGNAITVADVDANGGIEQVTASVSHGTFTVSTSGGATIVSGNGTATVVFKGTIAQLNSALGASSYTPTSSYTGSDTLVISVNDEGNTGTGGALTTTASLPITVITSPSVTVTGGTTLDYNKGASAEVVDSQIALTDNGANLWGASVTISGNYNSSQDELACTSMDGLAGTWESSSGELLIGGADGGSSEASVADYQAILRTVTFVDTSSSPSTATRTLSFQVHDNTTYSNIATDNIVVTTLTTANTAPQISVPGAQSSAENNPLVLSGSNAITVSDTTADGGQERVTLSASHGTLTLATTSSLYGVFGNGSGNLTFSGTIASLNTALNGLTYTPTRGYTGSDTIQVGINDDAFSGTGGPLTASATVSVSITAPQLTTTGGTTLHYTQQAAPGVIDAGLTLSDAGGTLTGATVSITGNFASGQDVLGLAQTSSGIIGWYNASTGVLSLSGMASVAAYQAALRNVTYEDTSLDPSTSTRTISFSFTDPDYTSSSATDSVAVAMINVAPAVLVPPSQLTEENKSLVLSGGNAISVSDVDANGGIEQVTLSAADGTLTLGSTSNLSSVSGNGSSTVVLSGTIANLNTALAGLTYAPNHNFVGVDTIQVSIDDEGNTGSGGALTISGSLGVAVNVPSITVTGGTTLDYTQGTAAAAIDPGLTLYDVTGTLTGATVAITGNFAGAEDVLGFTNTSHITGSYNATTGVLTLTGSDTLADYQAALESVTYEDTGDNPSTLARTVSFSFTDAYDASNIGNDSVTVTPVPPTISISPSSERLGENTSLVLPSNAITVGDLAGNGAPFQVTLAASDGTLTLSSTAGLSSITGNGAGSVVFAGSLSTLNADLAGLTYAPNASFAGQDSIAVSIKDEGTTGIGSPQTATASLSVTVVGPAITVTGGTTLNYTEGDAPGAIDANVTLSDFSGEVAGATVAITGNFASGEDVLQFTNTRTITGSYNATTGVLTLTGTDTLADYEAALDSVTYEDVSINPSTLTRTISFSFSDEYATSNVGNDNVTVTAVNPPPPITIPYLSESIEENTSLTLSDIAAIVVAGNDNSGGTDQVTLSVTNGTLSLGSTANVTASGNGTDTVVFSGTLAELNAALDGLTYTPTAYFAGSDSLQVSFSDEANSGGPLTASAAESIAIIAPTLTVTGGTTLDYVQGNAATAIDSGLTLSDPFSSTVTGATVAITGNFASAEDVLAFANTANITGTYDSSTGVLTLTGTDTLADYQAALRSVTYQDTSLDPSQLPRTISFSYTDSYATSNTAVDTVTVTAVNLPPTITMPVTSETIGENTSFVLSGANAITVADIDANGVPDQMTLSASDGTLTLGSTTGLTSVSGNGTQTVVFSGLPANLNAALDGLTYTPDSGFAGTDSISVSITNSGHTGIGGPQTANATLSVTVVAPTVTVTGGTTLDYTEGNNPGVIDANLTVTDLAGEVTGATVAITGNFAAGQDILSFANTTNITGSYNASTGVLTLSGNDTPADYQAALRSVTYEDTSSDPSTQTRTISFSFVDAVAAVSNTGHDNVTVTPLGAPPPLTIPFKSESIAENTSLVLSGISAIVVSGPDPAGGTDQVTLSVSEGTLALGTTSNVTVSGNGTDSVTFSGTLSELNAALDGLTYTPHSGYAGSDTLQIAFDDESAFGGPVTTDGSVSITVVAPKITVTGGTTLDYTQGNAAAAIDAGITLSDLTTTVTRATVAITGNFAGSQDVLGFTNTAHITGSYNATTGVLTLSGTDTLADYQAALRSVTYGDTSLDPSELARTISFSYTDAVGATSNTGVDQVAVTAVNLPPTIAVPVSSATINENTPLVLSGSSAITVADIDANGVADQITITAGDGTLTLGSTTGLTSVTGNGTATVVFSGLLSNLNSALNGLTYTPNNDFGGSDTITVTILNSGHTGIGGPQSATASVSITVVQPQIIASGVPLDYVQGAPAAIIDPTFTLSDLTGTVTGATVAITTNFASGQDVLGFTNTSTITGSYNASTGVLTLTGTDTLANYQAALESVTYVNTSDDPSTLARTVSFSYLDEDGPSNVATDTVNVMAVQQLPTITLPSGPAKIAVNSTLVFSGATGISVGDVDENGAIDTLTLTASDGTLTLGSAAGLTSVTGNGTDSVTLTATTVASLNAALAGLTYAPNQNYVGDDSIQISLEDPGKTGVSGALTTPATYDVVIGGPTVTVTGGTTLDYVKGSGAEVIDTGITLSDSQAAPSGATVAITGNFSSSQDVLSFVNTANITGTYDSQTGVLTLTGTDTLADYEAALRSVTYENTSSSPSTSPRTITFTFTDAYNESDSGVDRISVLNVSPPSGAPTIGNLALVDNHGASAATSNPVITGALFDDPTQNGSDYAVQIDWSGSGTVNATVDVTPGTPFSYNLSGDVAYGSVTVQVRGTEVTASGTLYGAWTSLTFQYDAPPLFGSSSYSFNTTDQITSGSVVGTLTATDANSGVTLTYAGPTDSVEPFTINSTNGQISYIGSGAPAGGTYNLVFDVSDGLGSVVTVPVAITVTVEHAVAENGTAQVAENATLTYNVLDYDTVPPTRTVTVAIVTQPQDGTVTIDGTDIDYTPNSNFVGTDTLVYSLTDDLGAVSTATLTINVVEDPAPIANPGTFSAYSGQTTNLNVLANDSDPAGNTLTIISATTSADGAGTVTIVQGTDGAPDELAYTAPNGFIGTEVITYIISDPLGSTATTTATVNVTALPAPVVTALTLNSPSNDPTQLITSDPAVSGTVQSTLPYSQDEMQFSFDEGSTIAGTATVNNDGDFDYDASSYLGTNYGEVTLYARAVYLDGNGNVTLAGNWDIITFQYVAPQITSTGSTGAATFSALSVATNTTAEVVITGTTTLDANGNTPSIQWDFAGDGIPSGVTTTENSDQEFSQTFTTQIGYGTVVIYARTVSGPADDQLFGAWQEVTFYRDPPAASPPDLSNLALVDNTGTQSAPATTTALISGTAINRDGSALGAISVQVDLTGDGTPNWSFTPTINSDGSFTVDLDSMLTTDGSITVYLRAEATDTQSNEVLYGPWHEMTFQYSGNAAAVPQITDVSVVDNVGTTGSPATSDLLISGVVDAPLADYSWLDVEVSLNGSSSPAATIAVNDLVNGTFTVNLSGLGLTAGPVTADFTATGWDNVKQETLTGSATEFDFTYTPAAPATATVSSLQLVDDTDPTAGYTSDPVVSGIATFNGQPLSQVPVQFELNGDTTPDGTIYTTTDGSFTFDPRDYNVQQGPVTLSFQAGVWSDQAGGYVFGAWQTISYTYQVPTPTTSAPTVGSLEIATPANSDGSYSNPVVTGLVTASGSTDNLPVEFSINDNGVVDGTTYTDSTGSGIFLVDLVPYLTANGSYTVAFRAGETDPNSGDTDYGDWVTITFNYEASQAVSGNPPSLTLTSNIPVPQAEYTSGTQFSSGTFDFVEDTIDPGSLPSGPISAPSSPGASIIDAILASAAANTPDNGVPVTTNTSNTVDGTGETTTTTDQTTTTNSYNVYQVSGQELEIQQITVGTTITVDVAYTDGSGYQATETDTYSKLVETYLFGSSDSYVYTNVSSNEQLTTNFLSTSGSTIYTFNATRTFSSNEDYIHEADTTQPGPLSAFSGIVSSSLLTTLENRPLFQDYATALAGPGNLDSLSQSSALDTSDSVGNTLAETSQSLVVVTALVGDAQTTQGSWSTSYSQYTPINESLTVDTNVTTPLDSSSYVGSLQTIIDDTETLTGYQQITQSESGTWSVDSSGTTTTTWQGSSANDLVETLTDTGTQTTIATLSQSGIFWGTGFYDATFENALTGTGTLNTTNDADASANGSWTTPSSGYTTLTAWSGNTTTTDDTHYCYTDTAVQTGSGSWNDDEFGDVSTTGTLSLDMDVDTDGHGCSSIVTTGTYGLSSGGALTYDVTTHGKAHSFESIDIPTDTSSSQNNYADDVDGADSTAQENATASASESIQITINSCSTTDNDNGVVTDSGSTTQDTTQAGTDTFTETTTATESSTTGTAPLEVDTVSVTSNSSYTETDTGSNSSDITTSWVNDVYTTNGTFQTTIAGNYALSDYEKETYFDQNIGGGPENSCVTEITQYGETGTTNSTTDGTIVASVTTATTDTTDITNYNWDNTVCSDTWETFDFPVFDVVDVDVTSETVGTDVGTARNHETYNDQGTGVDTYQATTVAVTAADGTSTVTGTSTESNSEQGVTTETDCSSGSDHQTATYAFAGGTGVISILQTEHTDGRIVTRYGTSEDIDTTISSAAGNYSTETGTSYSDSCQTACTTAVSTGFQQLYIGGFTETIEISNSACDHVSEESCSTLAWSGNSTQGMTYEKGTSDVKTERDNKTVSAEVVSQYFDDAIPLEGALQGLAVVGFATTTNVVVQNTVYDTDDQSTQVLQLQSGVLATTLLITCDACSEQEQAENDTATSVNEVSISGRERYIDHNTTAITNEIRDDSLRISNSDGYTLDKCSSVNTAYANYTDCGSLWVGENATNFTFTTSSLDSTGFDQDSTSYEYQELPNGTWTKTSLDVETTAGTTPYEIHTTTTDYNTQSSEPGLPRTLNGYVTVSSGLVGASFRDVASTQISSSSSATVPQETVQVTNQDSGTTFASKCEYLVSTALMTESPPVGYSVTETSTVTDEVHNHSTDTYRDFYQQTTVTDLIPNEAPELVSQTGSSFQSNTDCASVFSLTTTLNTLIETLNDPDYFSQEIVSNYASTQSSGTEFASQVVKSGWGPSGTWSIEWDNGCNTTQSLTNTTNTIYSTVQGYIPELGPGWWTITNATTETEVDFGSESDVLHEKISTNVYGPNTVVYSGQTLKSMVVDSYGTENGSNVISQSDPWANLTGFGYNDSVTTQTQVSNWYNILQGTLDSTFQANGTQVYSGSGQQLSYSQTDSASTTLDGYSSNTTTITWEVTQTISFWGSFQTLTETQITASDETYVVNPDGSDSVTVLEPPVGFVSQVILEEISGAYDSTNTTITSSSYTPGYAAESVDYQTVNSEVFNAGTGYTKTVYVDGSYEETYSEVSSGFWYTTTNDSYETIWGWSTYWTSTTTETADSYEHELLEYSVSVSDYTDPEGVVTPGPGAFQEINSVTEVDTSTSNEVVNYNGPGSQSWDGTTLSGPLQYTEITTTNDATGYYYNSNVSGVSTGDSIYTVTALATQLNTEDNSYVETYESTWTGDTGSGRYYSSGQATSNSNTTTVTLQNLLQTWSDQYTIDMATGEGEGTSIVPSVTGTMTTTTTTNSTWSESGTFNSKKYYDGSYDLDYTGSSEGVSTDNYALGTFTTTETNSWALTTSDPPIETDISVFELYTGPPYVGTSSSSSESSAPFSPNDWNPGYPPGTGEFIPGIPPYPIVELLQPPTLPTLATLPSTRNNPVVLQPAPALADALDEALYLPTLNPVNFLLEPAQSPELSVFFDNLDALDYARISVGEVANANLQGVAIQLVAPGLIPAGPLDFLATQEFVAYGLAQGSQTLTYSVQSIVDYGREQMELVAGSSLTIIRDATPAYTQPVLVESGTMFVGVARDSTAFTGVPTNWGCSPPIGKELEDASVLAQDEPAVAFATLLSISANDNRPYEQMLQADEALPQPGDTGGGPAANQSDGGRSAVAQLETDIELVDSLFGESTSLDQLLDALSSLAPFPFEAS